MSLFVHYMMYSISLSIASSTLCYIAYICSSLPLLGIGMPLQR
jgi:hypothetical protein